MDNSIIRQLLDQIDEPERLVTEISELDTLLYKLEQKVKEARSNRADAMLRAFNAGVSMSVIGVAAGNISRQRVKQILDQAELENFRQSNP